MDFDQFWHAEKLNHQNEFTLSYEHACRRAWDSAVESQRNPKSAKDEQQREQCAAFDSRSVAN